jgi:hypothetical protein
MVLDSKPKAPRLCFRWLTSFSSFYHELVLFKRQEVTAHGFASAETAKRYRNQAWL